MSRFRVAPPGSVSIPGEKDTRALYVSQGKTPGGCSIHVSGEKHKSYDDASGRRRGGALYLSQEKTPNALYLSQEKHEGALALSQETPSTSPLPEVKNFRKRP